MTFYKAGEGADRDTILVDGVLFEKDDTKEHSHVVTLSPFQFLVLCRLHCCLEQVAQPPDPESKQPI